MSKSKVNLLLTFTNTVIANSQAVIKNPCLGTPVLCTDESDCHFIAEILFESGEKHP
jgi:hypothetical protein